MKCLQSFGSVLLMVIIVHVQLIESTEHRAKRLTDVVCDAGTTKIIPPNYFRPDSPGWCGSAVGLLSNDFYNLAYRQECQRWLGGNLPDSVAQAQLVFCYEYPNATVIYRMGVCCHGVPTGLRCFSGQRGTPWWTQTIADGSMNYAINYEEQLVTCQPDEVCQNMYTFYGSNGAISNWTMAKGCAKADVCTAVNDPVNGTCRNCVVEVPACTTCCSTSFCNYDYQFWYTWNALYPAVCPPPKNPKYPCNDGPCQNGALCFNIDYIDSDLGYANYTCSCTIQWAGRNCSDNRTLCEFTNPCQNGGTCYDYSDEAPGSYRCYCPEPFVGDRCELQSNLTCNTSDTRYVTQGVRLEYGINCTQLAWTRRDFAEQVVDARFVMQSLCGANGRVAPYRIQFELKTCSHGQGMYTWNSYHSCCLDRSVCSSQPCLNGGTCYDYSDVTPGDYRCECPAPFIGDNCEFRSTLTCNISDQFYQPRPPAWFGYQVYQLDLNCTSLFDMSRNKPSYGWPGNGDVLGGECSAIRRKSDGHAFIQGVDGQINPDKFEFEATYCARTNHFTSALFHTCCPTCLSSPCQNGGYCLQLSSNDLVCKCTAGFNGKFCENRVAFCSVSGDPHYRTFDGKPFEYQGTCKHNLASPCNTTQQPYFNVYVKNENRPNVPTVVSFPSYVEVVYNLDTVRLSRVAALYNVVAVPVVVTVNGLTVQVPYSTSDWNIYYDGKFVRYDAWFGLSVAFDGYWTITVNVPTNLHVGTMCGLCGNNDNNPNNDLTMANGTYVGNLPTAGNLVGDGYVVFDPTQKNPQSCPAPPPPPPCDPVPPAFQSACGLINDTSNVFGICISRIGAAAAAVFADNCIMDACFTNGTTICSSVKTFVDVCASSGVLLPCSNWQTVSGCGASVFCPAGMIYKCAASACLATCADPTAPDFCPYPNKDACVCPPGQLLYNGTCTLSCPVACSDHNKQLRKVGEQWTEPGCITVRCVECVNCTNPAERVTTNNCPNGMVCQNGSTCVPVSTKATTTTTTRRPKKGKKQRRRLRRLRIQQRLRRQRQKQNRG